MHGAVPRPARVQVHDVEQGKKDDDAWKQGSSPSTPKWNAAVPRFRKRRWAALILAMGLFYIFFKNIPEGLTPVSHRADRRVPGRTVNNMPIRVYTKDTEDSPQVTPQRLPATSISSTSSKAPKPTKKPQSITKGEGKEELESQSLHYYDGKIGFPVLASTLEAEPLEIELNAESKVLFAAGNLESAAILIPMACGMAQATNNEVHFAYFGRDDLPLEKIRQVNGAEGGCKMMWHDARPDHSVHSSDQRFTKAVSEALSTIYAHLRTEVFFTVETPFEERPFREGLESATRYRTLIEVPSKKSENLMWLTRLDGKSLSSWKDLDIKILIQVTKENVGGLFQLLKSIYTADYTGHNHPHIIFEIPADLDIPSLAVVTDFSWPPRELGDRTPSKVTIRKRVSHRHEGPLASAIRTVENFYPTNPVFEHILILSADVQLSKMWYHYLVYNVLQYAYSFKSAGQFEPVLLAGISLITPLRHVADDKVFKPPKYTPPALIDPDAPPPEVERPENVPFMWQAPDTMATLYFGAKWRELHSFLSHRIDAARSPAARKMPQTAAAFAEPLNELMSLRGWSVLYPNLPGHKIAAHQPSSATREEFMPVSKDTRLTSVDPDGAKDADPYAAVEDPLKNNRFSSPADVQKLASTPIHNIIPNKGVLSVLRWLPLIDLAGKPTTTTITLERAKNKRSAFRKSFGRCSKGAVSERKEFTVDDLFCTELGTSDLSGPSGGSFAGDGNDNGPSGVVEDLVNYDPTGRVMSEELLAKVNRVNHGPTPEELEANRKRTLAQMQNEFLEHLQRQGSAGGKESNADEDKAEKTSAAPAKAKSGSKASDG